MGTSAFPLISDRTGCVCVILKTYRRGLIVWVCIGGKWIRMQIISTSMCWEDCLTFDNKAYFEGVFVLGNLAVEIQMPTNTSIRDSPAVWVQISHWMYVFSNGCFCSALWDHRSLYCCLNGMQMWPNGHPDQSPTFLQLTLVSNNKALFKPSFSVV